MGIEAAIAATVVSSIVAANGARSVGKAQQAANNFNANNPEAPRYAKLPSTRKILQNNIASICKL